MFVRRAWRVLTCSAAIMPCGWQPNQQRLKGGTTGRQTRIRSAAAIIAPVARSTWPIETEAPHLRPAKAAERGVGGVVGATHVAACAQRGPAVDAVAVHESAVHDRVAAHWTRKEGRITDWWAVEDRCIRGATRGGRSCPFRRFPVPLVPAAVQGKPPHACEIAGTACCPT